MNCPILYEINTRCWLRELGARLGQAVTLGDVPGEELLHWQRLGFNYIWLMGLWSSGPLARQQALAHPDQQRVYAEALPDLQEVDVGGSPYAVADYQVPLSLGGEEGLSRFRQKLQAHGLRLVLDFVPNHLGLDHGWVRERPDLFVQSALEAPGTFPLETDAGKRWLAHGKDPHFAPWTDTVQLDYRRAETRTVMTELLQSVARRCDGVRCDMAMLPLNEVFARTWERFPGSAPREEFWPAAIAAVKRERPDFLFLAEVYWGLEPRMQALGFDYTYDKDLYDKLVSRDAAGVQRQLLGMRPASLAAGAHFLENHDEPRIAAILSPAEHRAAALLILALPGLRFLHEGQLTGARVRTPVQLLRRCREPDEPQVRALYEQLLSAVRDSVIGRGSARLLQPRNAWPDNPSAQNFVLIQWQAQPPGFDLVVVNLATHRGQCYAPLDVPHLENHDWTLKDRLSRERHQRMGAQLRHEGLYLDLPAHGAQIFEFEPRC